MKKKFEYTEKKGLPGGPNEYITHVSGMFSTEGYKRNSPDVNNPYNIIPSGDITMKGVDFPVMGTDNLGNTKAMIPGNDYKFPGDVVFETPLAKYGGGLLTKTMKCNSCGWKWKAADGGNDVSTCHKCGGEALPTAQNGREQATISAYEEPAWYEKAVDYLASPMTSLGYLARGQDLPDRIPINVEDRNIYDMIIDMVNPAAMIKYGAQAKRDYDNEEYLNSAFNTLGALPIVPAVLSQGKNVVKGGKNVIKNVAKYTDEVAAGSDDIFKATVRDVKPRAKNLDAVTEVNPLSQAQAQNLLEQGRNAEIFKAFEEGANTIDDFVKSYTGDLSSPEGFKRLVQQEADYLRTIGFDEARIATQAETNAGARLNEIINIGNKNKAFAQGERSAEHIVKNNYNFNNASYSANTRNADYFDDIFYKPGTEIDVFNLNRTKVGSKVLPGQTNLGTMYNNSKAVAAHEIGGHGLQSGRRLPVDSRLKKLEPLSEMNEGTAEAYRYFMQGSKGKEPSAYLHELRQAMLDNKLIRNRYDYVSPEQLKRYQTLFDLRPSGTVNTIADKFHSNTRILDFMKPTKSNFDLLARELNKLPAMVPIGVAGAAGAAALPQEKYGGQLAKAQNGNGEYTVKSGDTFYGIANKNNISKEDLIKANPGIDIQNLKLNQTIKFPVQDNVQDNVQKPEETSWSDYINPMNWGVSDRDDDGGFKEAFRAARQAGEDEFMWYGTRYTTDLKSTSKQAPKQAPSKPVEKVKEEQSFNITPQLLYKQAFVESRLDPKAKNSLGYMGLGQIGKGVITDYKKATGVKEVDPFDPKQNHDVQEWSMNELYNASFIDKPGATAENRLIKALASYNYGRKNVLNILEAEKAKGNDIYKSNDWTKQLPKETREYIDMIVYDGVTEKRPDVQTNFKKATEEDEYKDLRELYKYQLKGEVPSTKTEDSKYPMLMDTPYLGYVGDKFVQEQRIVAQDNTRVSIPAINKNLVKVDNLKKLDIDQGEYQFDIPLDLTVAQDNTYVNPIKQINDIPLASEELDIAEREYKRPNLTSNFTEAVNDYKPKNKYEKDYTNASETEIKELQKTLIKEGYGSLLGDFGDDENGVDGKFGPKTKAAYESLISEGDLGLNNIDKFYKKYSNNNKIPVKKLQAELVEKGYLSEKTKDGKTNIDGKFGDRTKKALQEYNTSEKNEDPDALIFNNIPNKLEDKRCAAGMCAILEDNNVITESLGIKYKNAWDIHENMMNAGNSESIYNIYTEPEFANVGPETTAEELKSITKQVKNKSQTKESDYKVGDIVGLYWPGSNYHETTVQNSKTFNTHVGFVSDFDKNGKPIITHNVNGNVLQQPYDQLQTTWISRPKENVKLNKKYDASAYQDVEINQNILSNFEAKKERPLSTNEKDVVTNIMKRAKYNSQSIPEMLNSSVDKNWLNAATFAITGVESSGGISPNTPRTVEEAASQNYGLQGLAYAYKGKTPEDISLGVAKVKFNSLDPFAKEYFDIQSPEDLANDNKATDAASYLLVKHYELFKNYGEQYPEFGLTEEDFRNMAILAHNQGSNLLLKTGRNNLKSGTRSSEDQIESLRKLYQGSIKDVSSTKLNHLGELGEWIYDLTEDEGSETYISKSNRYINEVYNKQNKKYAGVSKEKTTPPAMSKGGEYKVFSDYIYGVYDNTPQEKEAQKIYDKLNRVHYKDAKKAGTTVPNYILSVLMNTSND